MTNVTGFDLRETEHGVEVWFVGRLVLVHTSQRPCLRLGRGALEVESHLGHYRLAEQVEWVAADAAHVMGDAIRFLDRNGEVLARAHFAGDALTVQPARDEFRYVELSLHALEDESVWGGGEQFSYLDLRGRAFPLWVGEPGVGRDPTGPLARHMEETPLRAGDYWTTNYPQPTFLSSRLFAWHVDSPAYVHADFTLVDAHQVRCFDAPCRVEFFSAETMLDLVSALAEYFRHPPSLPDWALSGAIIGLKDGERSFARLDAIIAAGAAVTGLWCEDWAGIRQTDFGRRLFWDWKASEDRFPNLAARIADLRERGIRFLAYVNPYLATDGEFYHEAEEKGFLVRDHTGEGACITDFGGFTCGHVDLTNGAAADWFAERIIGREMLDIGIAGWMADFGEYLPTDATLADGSDAMLAHNRWPMLWARTNAEAVKRRDKAGEAVFFMRAGHSGSQAYCPLLWAGDQSVDFSFHDGIGTTVVAALSAGLVGNPCHHSDIGGYTSLFGNVRSSELVMRWAELAAFTPVMRTHEGNRPNENLQVDSTPELLAHFARMTRLHAAMAPYTSNLCEEAARTGLPLQRPLFLHYWDDLQARRIERQYLYGPDLLLAPVLESGARYWPCYLPAGDDWQHLWSGEPFVGGAKVTVAAPFGLPPVFVRKGCARADFFRGLGTHFTTKDPPE
ncbi:alpha-glucosidase [Qipengyuania sp. XHP0207]|uniref:alpha-glucosidase n=1 Tax=Qipengyuania sp. XHP0207 TaxID=3038078 RepID=UPI00241CFFC3|nr:alpha-glucosidase [Qipengyuania sp. XHP0207]MDG5746939.1 alpha-glucosidase [Qipengyuania sp. XHP0207]